MKADPLFRFVHCADLHLDSPFRGIQNLDPAIAGILREATFKSFGKIVDFAIGSRADFLIISGDVYNQADRSLHAQLKFRDLLQRASDNGIRSFICHGNHDPVSGWEANIKFPEAVHRFSAQNVEKITIRRENEPLANIYGISYPEREVTQNLSREFKKEPGSVFSIGILHCNIGGDRSHDNYAPCTVEDLAETGLDYWALGHIHASRVIRHDHPCIVYPGCIQGLDVLEEGAHGCYLVSVLPDGQIDIRFQPTDEVRWYIKEVDIQDLSSMQELLDALSQACQEASDSAEGRTALLRLRLIGRGFLHNQLRNHIDPERDIATPLRDARVLRQGNVWVESVQVETRPLIDIAARRKADDSVGDFLKASEALENSKDADEIIKSLLHREAPRFLAGFIDQLSAADLKDIRDTAERLGLEKLLPEE